MPESPLGQAPCIFCRLLDGSEPASLVYRDDRCAVFMDIVPVNPGHMLVVPNEHAPSMADLDAEMAAHLMRVAHRLTAGLRASWASFAGGKLFLAGGEAPVRTGFTR